MACRLGRSARLSAARGRRAEIFNLRQLVVTMNPFRNSVTAWPALAPFGRLVHLPGSQLDLFMYEMGAATAPPVLLIHGLGGEADTWRHVLPALAVHYRLLVPDLPGSGRSGVPAHPLGVPGLMRALLELLDTLGLAQVGLIGHSMGAVIAHAIARDTPTRAAWLVLIGGSLVHRVTRVDPQTALMVVPGLGEWLYNRRRRDPQAAFRSLEPYYGDFDHLPAADRAYLYQRVNERVWSDTQRASYLGTLRSLVRWTPRQQRDLPARLASMTTPTLAIWGANDRINALANGQALPELQPGVELVTVPGGGHNVQEENPGVVLAAMARFRGLDLRLAGSHPI